ncbi:MAG: alpha/beta hydrolase-fold protein [Rhodoglobus sp.]
MSPFLSGIAIIGGPVPLVIDALAVVALLVLSVRRSPAGRRWRWLATVAAALVIGAGLGLVLCWLIGDVADAFAVTLTFVSRAWVSLAFAGIALAVVNLVHSRWRRRVGALGGILVFVLAGALGVNADFGQYTTLGSLTDSAAFRSLPLQLLTVQRAGAGSTVADPSLWKTWSAPVGMPKRGIVGSVTIPSTVSHFAARDALVYLPPAARVAHPPALPVLVMLSGQPGSPENVFLAGHLDSIMDGIAAKHGGLAPIVVVPDQLTAPDVNPMCVDSALGNSASYLTVDVPNWIRANLTVQADRTKWAIGGFSQGGTCSIQLGAAHPQLFGSLIDISGEVQPKIGSDEVTIARGFGGDQAAWQAAKPLSILAAGTPYADELAVFGVGGDDAKYLPGVELIEAAAQAAGMSTSLFESPGTAHDWKTVQYALEHGLPPVLVRMGLERPVSG